MFLVGVLIALLPQLYLLLVYYNFKKKRQQIQSDDTAQNRFSGDLRQNSSKDSVNASNEPEISPPLPPRKLPVDRVRFDIPSSDFRIYPRMFPPNMPAESGLVVDFLFKRIFFQWQSRAMAAKWCANINREFAQLEGKSKILNYVYASKLDLGLVPPSVQNIRILPTDPSRKDLELLAKVMYGGGLAMELHMQIQMYAIIEAHLKVTVKDFSADMLIRMASAPNDDSIPPNQRDENIYFTLTCAHPPQVEFDISSAVGNFTDLASIRQIVSNSLKAVLSRLIVDPNGKHYRLSPTEGFKSYTVDPKVRRAQSAQQKKRKVIAPVLGRMYITRTFLFYYIILLYLANYRIRIKQVREADIWLNSNDQPCSPYCIISFNRQTRRSKVLQKTMKPRWEETLTFDVLDMQDSVTLSLHDKGRLVKNDFIGHCTFQFGGLVPNERIKFSELVKRGKRDEDSGIIHFEALFESFERKSGSGVKTISYNKELGLKQFDNSFIDILSGNEANTATIFSKSESIVLQDDPSTDQLIPTATSSSASSSGLRNRTSNQGRSSESIDAYPETEQLEMADEKRKSLEEQSLVSLSNDAEIQEVEAIVSDSASDYSAIHSQAPLLSSPSAAAIAVPKKPSFVRRVTDNLSIADSLRSNASYSTDYSGNKLQYLLNVTVLQARGLMPADRSGFSDPYCIVSVGKLSKKTRVIKGTLSPIWNETLVFVIPPQMINNAIGNEITFTVFGKNKFTQHTFLGQVKIELPVSAWDSLVNGNSENPVEFSKTLVLQNRQLPLQQSSAPVSATQSSSMTLTSPSPSVYSQPLNASSNSAVTGEIDISISLEINHPPPSVALGFSPPIATPITVSSSSTTQKKGNPFADQDLVAGQSHSRSSSEDARNPSESTTPTTALSLSTQSSPQQQLSKSTTAQQLRQISAAHLQASKEAAKGAAKAVASNISQRFTHYMQQHQRNASGANQNNETGSSSDSPNIGGTNKTSSTSRQ